MISLLLRLLEELAWQQQQQQRSIRQHLLQLIEAFSRCYSLVPIVITEAGILTYLCYVRRPPAFENLKLLYQTFKGMLSDASYFDMPFSSRIHRWKSANSSRSLRSVPLFLLVPKCSFSFIPPFHPSTLCYRRLRTNFSFIINLFLGFQLVCWLHLLGGTHIMGISEAAAAADSSQSMRHILQLASWLSERLFTNQSGS